MKYVLARLKEPSTYAGLSGMFLAAGLAVPEWYGVVTQFLAAAVALAAMLLIERKP
jgi:hypothetical protein